MSERPIPSLLVPRTAIEQVTLSVDTEPQPEEVAP